MQKYWKLVQFSGVRHSVSVRSWNTTATPQLDEAMDKASPCYDEAQLPPMPGKVSFVRIDPADWKLPCNNQCMSSVKIYTVSVGNEEIYFTRFVRALWALPCNPGGQQTSCWQTSGQQMSGRQMSNRHMRKNLPSFCRPSEWNGKNQRTLLRSEI